MENVETLIEGCRLLFPSRSGEGEEFRADLSIATADGRIVAIEPAAALRGRVRAQHRVPANGRLLTPGFVDSHTHLVFAGDRAEEYQLRCRGTAYEEIAARGGGILSSVRATRAASEDQLYEQSLPRLRRMARHGTTTVEIKSGYGLDLDTELRQLRVIRRLDETTPVRVVPTFLGAHEIPLEHRADRKAYVDEVCERMIPAVAQEGLARYCDVFCEAGVFTPAESERILAVGQQHGLAAKVHADELAPSGGSAVAARVRATSADHLMMTEAAGIELLRAAGVVATLLPGTTFFLKKPRYAPARSFLEAGVPVALATDRNPGSCTIESMLFIIGLACLHLNMTPEEAFRAATEQGARALGLAGEVGCLAVGQAADMILWNTTNAHQIVYEFVNDLPRTVFIAGRELSF